MRCTRLPFLLVATSLLHAQDDRIEFTAAILPGDYVIQRGTERWVCHRIVDDLTGAPIAGAELFLVDEHEAPIGGRFWFLRRAVSDAEGIVRARIDDLGASAAIQVVRADGYAITSHPGNSDPVWRLPRPHDVPVLVCDWRGIPTPNALLGICGSCGHGPDLAWATSDANGIALLRGIDPHNEIGDLYVQCEGLALTYGSLQWSPGCPPYRLQCGYSPALTGRLLDHLGEPVAGAFVGSREVHRGPWAETAADGGFRVLGASVGSAPIAVVRGLPGQVREDVYFPTPASWPTTLHLPDPAGEDNYEGTVDNPQQDSPPPVATTRIAVEVEGGDTPAVGVAYPGRGDDAERDPPGEVSVPRKGPFVLTVGDRQYLFASLESLPQQPLHLRDFAPTLVRARVVDDTGAPVAVRARFHWGDSDAKAVACRDGALQLEQRGVGMRLLELQPERADLRPRHLFVPLPARGDHVEVDLGTLALTKVAQLRVVAAAGTSNKVRVGLVRDGFQQPGEPQWFDLDDAGGWLGPDLRAGDGIVVEPKISDNEWNTADGRKAVPFRTVLSGAGPWTITPPTGVLTLRVTGGTDEDWQAYAHFGDFSCWVPGPLELVGLTPGPLRVYLSGEGCKVAIVDTVIPATGKKELAVELPRLE